LWPWRPAKDVDPAALASTFVTSVAGVVTFTILSAHHRGSVAPDWPTGIALGIGGLAGAYTGARIQARLPDVLIRTLRLIEGEQGPTSCGPDVYGRIFGAVPDPAGCL
jgi:hypothetical protein